MMQCNSPKFMDTGYKLAGIAMFVISLHLIMPKFANSTGEISIFTDKSFGGIATNSLRTAPNVNSENWQDMTLIAKKDDKKNDGPKSGTPSSGTR
jgi:hypothetical protein